MRNELKCPKTSFEPRSRFSVLAGLFCLLIVMTFIPSAAHAEGAGELREPIRNLTRPVMESVRTVIRPNLNVNRDKAKTDPAKVTQTSDSQNKGDSPDSDESESSSVQ